MDADADMPTRHRLGACPWKSLTMNGMPVDTGSGLPGCTAGRLGVRCSLDQPNTTQDASGSSAGPGAATAAGLVGFAIGSDTGGSINSPSERNGLAGLRLTVGRVQPIRRHDPGLDARHGGSHVSLGRGLRDRV